MIRHESTVVTSSMVFNVVHCEQIRALSFEGLIAHLLSTYEPPTWHQQRSPIASMALLTTCFSMVFENLICLWHVEDIRVL